MGKTRRRLEVPLNDTAVGSVTAKAAVKHGPYVFYNPATGDRFYDLRLGFKAILEGSRYPASPGMRFGGRSPQG